VWYGGGGPDGLSLREYNMGIDCIADSKRIPVMLPNHFPVTASTASLVSRDAHNPIRQRLSEEQWQAIAVRIQCESLRALAKEYSVSHETIRRVAIQANSAN
jgi:hypothetical protein